MLMEATHKEIYEAPSVTVFEISRECIICASPTEAVGAPTYSGFNKEEEW